jgi:hypothetical protein
MEDGTVQTDDVARIRGAYLALVRGEPGQLVALLDREVHWRGVTRRRPSRPLVAVLTRP